MPYNKVTQTMPIETLAPAKVMIYPLSQHIGAACQSLVKPGDLVKIGQKIADTDLIQTLESSTKTTSIYSKDLNLVVQMTNANVEKIGNNLIKIYNKEDAQYVDYSGIQKQNTEVYPNNTIFAKSQNGKWGFVGKEGNVVVDYQYDEVTEINEYGFAGVKKDEKWGVIDKNGNIIVDCIYEINNQENPNFIGEYYEVSYGNGESYYTK